MTRCDIFGITKRLPDGIDIRSSLLHHPEFISGTGHLRNVVGGCRLLTGRKEPEKLFSVADKTTSPDPYTLLPPGVINPYFLTRSFHPILCSPRSGPCGSEKASFSGEQPFAPTEESQHRLTLSSVLPCMVSRSSRSSRRAADR